MTAEQFENAAFYVGQEAIFEGFLLVDIIGFSTSRKTFEVKTAYEKTLHVGFEFVEIINQEPLAILREIMRRMNSATGEPTACRLDPDLKAQIEKLFEDEQV